MRRRLMVVSNLFPPRCVGGAEIVASRHACLLQQQGWEVRVFCAEILRDLDPGSEGVVRHDHVEGLDVVRVLCREQPHGGDPSNPAMAALFARAFADFAPSVVHFHNLWGIGAALIDIAADAGARTVATLHDRGSFCIRGTLLRPDLSPCTDFTQCAQCLPAIVTPGFSIPIRLRNDYIMSRLARVDTLIAPSAGLAADFIAAGLPAERIEVLSSGIDLPRIPPRLRRHDETITFLCPAYIGEHKGIPQLIAALESLWADEALRGRWSCHIVGSGNLDAALRAQIRSAGFGNQVVFCGRVPRPELLERLALADVVVLPSICAENQPVSLVEGIASGAALLASHVPGNTELVEHGVNGLLYDAGSPAALAASMTRLIQDQDLVPAFSRANLARRDRYDERHTADRLVELYTAPPIPAAAPRMQIACATIPRQAAETALDGVPHTLAGHRVFLIWWEWLREPRDAALPLWLFRAGRGPSDWRTVKPRLRPPRTSVPRHAALPRPAEPPPAPAPPDAEIASLRARLVAAEQGLADARRAFLHGAAGTPPPAIMELSERARRELAQEIAQEIWRLRTTHSLRHRLVAWAGRWMRW